MSRFASRVRRGTRTPGGGSGTYTLQGLTRIPWEGGPAYWSQWSKPTAAGWTDPGFFPIAIWWCTFSSDAEVQWDKAHGINTYCITNPEADFNYIRNNGMYWLGTQLNATFDANSPNWVGYFLDDEVNGRYSYAEGLQIMQDLSDAVIAANDGRFRYANYTYQVCAIDGDQDSWTAYVNNFTDVVTLDAYWYSTPYDTQNWTNRWIVDIDPGHVRSASSYGRAMDALRIVDDRDSVKQSVWQFVENMYGGGDSVGFIDYITGPQIKAAAMQSIIHEARGLIWFNQSFGGPNQSGSVIRSAQVNPGSIYDTLITAMGEINNFIHSLAPVINTQSYVWTFGNYLDTMLKASNGYAYIFAMINGVVGSNPGTRTFSVPDQLAATGTQVEVVGESRTLTITGGQFTDNFPYEYTYHVYKIPIAAPVPDTTPPNPPVYTSSTTLYGSTPTVSGTAEPNSTIQLSVNGHTYAATTSGVGTWALVVTNALTIGSSYTLSATATDLANNTSAPGTQNVTIAPPATPADASGLTFWLKADAITGLTSGANVASWPDSSGNNNPAANASSGSQPTYITNVSPSGLPAVRWTTDALGSDSPASYAAQTIIVVMQPAAVSGDQSIVATDGSGLQLTLSGSTPMLLHQTVGLIGTASHTVSTTAINIVTATFDSTTGLWSIRVNGTISSGTTAASFPAGLTTSIGYRPFGSEPYNGDLFEIAKYNRVLSNSEIDIVTSGLKSKWQTL